MYTACHLLIIILHVTTIFPISASPDRFFKPSSSIKSNGSQSKYFELTHPPPSDHLTPSCTVHVIHHSFANTINHPPYSIPYSPPSDCSSPWALAVLEVKVNSHGDQYDRIAGIWLGGAELLRTSTAEPTESGIYWTVKKDVTRILFYNQTTELYRLNRLNSVDGDHPPRPMSTTLFSNRKRGLIGARDGGRGGGKAAVYETPADLVIPISESDYDKGYWFIINEESNVHYRKFRIPNNTYRVVLELYVSFHGNDEFWYSNPSNGYLRMNNLTSPRGNGAFREVFVMIDGVLVDSIVPFPVIFTGGINPLFWEPVVAIGAFDLPTYDLDITPFLGLLLDGKDHEIGLGVTDGIYYWLVDANLHLWLDHESASVEAKSVVYKNPGSFVKRRDEFRLLDGSLTIEGKRKTELVGWVKSSTGNFTTSVKHEFKFSNSIKFEKNGTYKQSKQLMKSTREVKVVDEFGRSISCVTLKRRYPLKVVTLNLPGSVKNNTYMLITNVSHSLYDKHSIGTFSSSVYNKQVSNGWMEVRDHDVISGYSETNQTLTCRDESGCYVRTVAVINSILVRDNSTHACPSAM
ncbi:Peptide-N4-(N-acetyl-beta-glucosaminyl)asparagine amidase A protein [Euphorbia peplus]|nr:Peptide-N4-(N-acetyl-beta-glucosaminyl)asparagine amidase A protein [Euphorbia peplus]